MNDRKKEESFWRFYREWELNEQAIALEECVISNSENKEEHYETRRRSKLSQRRR